MKSLSALPVRGDLESVSVEQTKGAGAVIHAAAFVGAWAPPAYEAVNVTGTERLLETAREAGVKRFAHVGTQAALFYGQHMRGVDETLRLALRSPFPYSRTSARRSSGNGRE